MTLESILRIGTTFAPLMEGEGTGGGGGGEGAGEGGDKDTGGDAGNKLGADAPTGIGDAENGGGGTAEGQDNPGDGDGDNKPEGDKPEGDKQPPKEGEKEGEGDGEGEGEGAPEEYDFAGVELPEGQEFDQGLADAITPVFKDLKLTQEQANSLVGAYAQHMQAQGEAQIEAVTQMVTGWKDTAKADKEVGRGNWQASVDAANAVIRQFGTPELVAEVMVGQGMGNHPEVIRLLSRIGKAIAEDNLDIGNPTDPGGDVSQEEAWYGNTTPTKRT